MWRLFDSQGRQKVVESAVDWVAYTTTWGVSSGGAPSLGNGTLTAKYQQTGKTVHLRLTLLMGSTTTYGGGPWTFTLPVTASDTNFLFHARAVDAGVLNYFGQALGQSSTLTSIIRPDGSFYAATIPFTWGSGDSLMISGTYEAA